MHPYSYLNSDDFKDVRKHHKMLPILMFDVDDNEIDRKINVTAILFLLVQNRQQTHDSTLIGSGANGLGIQECITNFVFLIHFSIIHPSPICPYIHIILACFSSLLL